VLESQNAELTADNQRVQRLEVDLEAERERSFECQRQLDDTIGHLRNEQLRSQAFQSQVLQLQALLDNKQQLTDVKEQMLQRIQNEYEQVMTDYRRILELTGVQTGQLRQARVEICELEAQVEELRGSRRRPSETPILPRQLFQPPFEDEIPVFDTEPFPLPAAPPHFEIPAPEVPKPRSVAKPAALVDNISFGNEPSGIAVDDIDIMSTEERRDLLAVLRAQKEEVERRLNKAPEKGRLAAHVRRDQEEREQELEVLNRRISKIRYALRKTHDL
jgi:hypothetical protein